MADQKRLIDANALTVPERKEAGDPFIDGFQQGKIDAIIEVRTLAPPWMPWKWCGVRIANISVRSRAQLTMKTE